MARQRRSDDGQAIGLILMTIVIVAAVAAAVSAVAVRMVERSSAQSAADAAAIAGVGGGRDAANGVAARNGGVLVSFASRADVTGVTVTVRVRVGEEVAMARASDVP